MKLKFDAELDFQRDSIEAVTASPPRSFPCFPVNNLGE